MTCSALTSDRCCCADRCCVVLQGSDTFLGLKSGAVSGQKGREGQGALGDSRSTGTSFRIWEHRDQEMQCLHVGEGCMEGHSH